MSDFNAELNQQINDEEKLRNEQTLRDQQQEEQGRRNIADFITYVTANGIAAKPIPPKVTYTTNWRNKQIEHLTPYPLPGWSALVAKGDMSPDSVVFYVLTDHRVVDAKTGEYVSPRCLFHTPALVTHARQIVASRDPHYARAF